MRVAIYSRTPMAGAPWELYKALRRYTDLDVALVNDFVRYADGRVFPHHLLLSSQNGTARAAMERAEVWHVNNYLTQRIRRLRHSQRVLAQFHSLPRLGNWRDLMRWADTSYTIDQPGQLTEYAMPGLPNIVDPDELIPQRRPTRIAIAFAPTNRMPPGRPDSKGYHQVKAVLGRVATKRAVDIIWIEGRPYEENLKMKARAHILIDDVVTGNWHRTALEGASLACAVVSSSRRSPFVYATLSTLEERLLWLIDNPAAMRDYQERARLWMLQERHPIELTKKYVAAYRRVLNAR